MTKTRLTIFVTVVVAILGLVLAVNFAQGPTTDAERYEGTIAAPEFPADLDWLNIENGLNLQALQGKVVMLDFWTYGCINCIHMIPVLRDLEEKYAEELVVIGVHSAKFENEGQTENIQQIVQRYDVHHPVINDSDFSVWQTYGVRAWPTFMIIDPRGNVVASQSGEVPFEAFDQYLGGMIAYYDQLGVIDRTPLDLALEGAGDPGTPLLFPGKVLVDDAGGRLFIADTNHHRIVIADLDTYEVLDTIGTGRRGYNDSNFEESQFDQPQGMAIDGDTLYVADVNNHAIRRVDLDAQTVETILGTGRKGQTAYRFDTTFNNPLSADIRSPWDVELVDEILYIAMAGTHQIWQLNLETNVAQAAVGNGREAQLNTTLADSELAQPSGLYYDDGLLYFADSESSTIRVANVPENELFVASGTTNNSLFEFGDVDGVAGESLLQHALGVDGNEDGSAVYIADTYNSKIKVYDPETTETTTLFGLSGNGGYRDGDSSVAQFDEPGGIDYYNSKLYVPDTNNHVIRIIDLEAGVVDTLQFPNPEALVINNNAVTVLAGNSADAIQITVDEQTVAAGEGTITVNLALPDGYKINPLTDSFVTLSSDSEAVAFAADSVTIETADVTIPAMFATGESTVTLNMTIFYCEAENEAFCLIDDSTLIIPVSVSDGSASDFAIERTITLPEGIANTGL